MKSAIIFPGQGCQYIGMGQSLFSYDNSVKAIFEEAEEITKINIRDICFQGSLIKQNEITNMLPCILTVNVAAYHLYRKTHTDIKDENIILAGHSLGEYAALVCGGAMSFHDAMTAVMIRGKIANRFISEKNTCMSIIEGLRGETIKDVCDIVSDGNSIVDVSCYNSKKQSVISGHIDVVKKAEVILKKLGGVIIPNPYMAPFHTRILKKEAIELEEWLDACDFHEMKNVIFSNYQAQPYNVDNVAHCLKHQFVSAVQWEKIINNFVLYPVNSITEVGPRSILTKIIEEDYPTVRTQFFTCEDIPFKESSPFNSEEETKILFVKSCCKMALCTENKCDNEQEYYEGVIKPYDQMLTILNEVEASRDIDPEKIDNLWNLLLLIFKTKKVSEDEINTRISLLNRIYHDDLSFH